MNFHIRLPWAAPKPVRPEVLDRLLEATVEAAAAREALRHIPKREKRKDAADLIAAKAATTAKLREELRMPA